MAAYKHKAVLGSSIALVIFSIVIFAIFVSCNEICLFYNDSYWAPVWTTVLGLLLGISGIAMTCAKSEKDCGSVFCAFSSTFLLCSLACIALTVVPILYHFNILSPHPDSEPVLDYTSIAYWGAMAVAAGSLGIISLVIMCKCCCHDDDTTDHMDANKTDTVTVIQLNGVPQVQTGGPQPAHGYGAPPAAQGYGAPPAAQGYGAPPAAQGYGAPPYQGSLQQGIQLQDAARPPPFVPSPEQTLQRPFSNATAPPATLHRNTQQQYLIEENQLQGSGPDIPPALPISPRPNTLNRNVGGLPPDLPTTPRPNTLNRTGDNNPPQVPNTPRPNTLRPANNGSGNEEPPELPTSARPNSLTRRGEDYLPDDNEALDYNYVEPNPGPNRLGGNSNALTASAGGDDLIDDYLDPNDLNGASDHPSADYFEPIAGPGEENIPNSQYNYAEDGNEVIRNISCSHNDGVSYY